jgi:CSLREA domain-containing protein
MFTVNTTDDTDDGVCSATHCSLREAISAANAAPGTDSIVFGIAGSGIKTIKPTSALPTISDSVNIDGQSTPGAALEIELDGSLAGLSNGLVITAGNSSVRDLIINRFTGAGILLSTGGSNTVTGNVIGMNATLTQAAGNRDGVYIFNSATNIVGGISEADRNIIAGNTDDGVNFEGPGAANNFVQGNSLGYKNASGSTFGNGGDGIKISNASGQNEIWNNIIAYNAGHGILGEFDVNAASSNLITRNRIFSNNGLGIDLNGDGVTANDLDDSDTGANNLQNYPVLLSASTRSSVLTLVGALNSTASATFRLEFFASPNCDPSGSGEGQHYLGSASVNTDRNGDVVLKFELNNSSAASGQWVTATATDAANNTSEFSACVQITNPPGVAPGINAYSTLTPTLSWTRVSWAQGYRVQVDNNSDFSSPEYENLSLPASALEDEAMLPAPGVYYWRVCALGATGTCGGWSARGEFRVLV